jgi:hypothetical protein
VIYTDKEKNKKDIQNNSEFSACFMILKLLNSDRRKAELITDKEQMLLTGTRYKQSVYKRLCTTSSAPGIQQNPG